MNDYSSRKCCHKNSMSMMNNNMNIDMMDDFCDEDTNIVTTAQSDCANLCTMPQNNCDCGFDMDTESVFPDNPMLAQSYVPIQKMNKVFTPDGCCPEELKQAGLGSYYTDHGVRLEYILKEFNNNLN